MSSEAHSISLIAPVVLLAAAVIAVPIFKRIGLGSVLGYLIAGKTFNDALNHMFDSMLVQRQEELIARDRTHGLSSEERRELWQLNQELAKK